MSALAYPPERRGSVAAPRVTPRRCRRGCRWRIPQLAACRSPLGQIGYGVIPLLLIVLSMSSGAVLAQPRGRTIPEQPGDNRPIPALTPVSPQVRAAVDRGLDYLRANEDRRPGGKALCALAFLKAGVPKDDPQILAGVEAIRETLRQDPYAEDVYTNGISLIFLSELDAATYRVEIDRLFKLLLARQKSHGGWGYDNARTGDTSMTPHAVLAMWAVSQAGIQTPVEAWDKVAGWLVRTQDPSGAWGYQGKDSGSYSELVTQAQVRHSLAASGLSCLYVYQAFIGFSDRSAGANRANLSAALKEVVSESDRQVRSSTLNPSVVLAAQQRGTQWLEENFKIAVGQYSHYYLYALERYESFREVVDGGSLDPSPRWYREGAQWLIDTQHADGWWNSYAHAGRTADTAFAILFMVRSAQQSVEYEDRLGAGRLAGGRQLLDGGAAVPVAAPKVRPKTGPAEELLAASEDPNHPDHEAAIEGYRLLTQQAEHSSLAEPERRLRELAGGRDPEKRLAAVRALGRRQDLGSVPTLIYALSDPDVRVFLAAREGLRFLSRKFQGVGIEGVPNEEERRAEIARWQQWYRSVQPDVDFAR